MPSLQQIAAASAMLSLAAAAPVQEKRAAAFTVHQVKNSNFTATPIDLYKADVNKWQARRNKAAAAGSASSGSSSSSGAVSPGSVTATPQSGDTEYLCPVTIGDQQFILDFDTGSSDTWVLGSSVAGGSHTGYSPSSSASKQSGQTWSISYGDGSSASGDVYTDTITIGGTTISNQAIERATKAAAAFTSGAEDGLVGLAWDSINTVSPNRVKTFMDNAIAGGLQPVFTADLKPGQPGSYDFGQIDSSKYSGSITYVSVDNSQGFWGFSPDQLSAGIADTGTTLIYLDDNTVSNYYSQVSSAQQGSSENGGLYEFDCNDSLPDFTVSIGGTEFTVPGSDINMGDAGDGSGQCLGGIQTDDSIGIPIFGDVFLKSVFVVFDLGQGESNPQIGFAKKA